MPPTFVLFDFVPAGADVVRFVPPLVVKAEQVDAALGILEECLAEA